MSFKNLVKRQWKVLIVILIVALLGGLSAGILKYQGDAKAVADLRVKCDLEYGIDGYQIELCNLGFCCIKVNIVYIQNDHLNQLSLQNISFDEGMRVLE